MNKDVIYIDVEDDITAIIGKVKAGREKIVALVPPKRIGVLQSAVNLRLLQRAAQQDKKHLVLISNNQALSALAAAAQIPVARNLQSKPEIPEIAALSVDDDDDIIDGAQLPIGELERTSDATGMGTVAFTNPAIDAAVGADAAEESNLAKPPVAGQTPARARVKSGVKVPNFNRFRKKLLLAGAGVVLLIAFLVWAIGYAPRATVIITARTTDSSMNAVVALDTASQTDLAGKTLHATTQQVKKDVSIAFTATGTKDVGATATGTVVFSTSDAMTAIKGVTIPAGTVLTSSSGLVYTTDSSLAIGQSNFQGAPVSVTAAGSGTKYNGASGAVGGAPSKVNASFQSATSGGTDKTITVVTQDDVQKATDQLNSQDTSGIKKQLASQFPGGVVTIDQSFKADASGVTSTPAVGQESTDGKAVFAGSVSYTLTGIGKNEIDQYLNAYYAAQLKDSPNQRVYDNGAKDASFTNVAVATTGYTATMVATAKIGPTIDDTAIKNAAKGKNYGDIQSTIEAIQGVDNVDIKFWPFWVSKAPNDTKRITVEFSLNGK
jgi:hypothetical protein